MDTATNITKHSSTTALGIKKEFFSDAVNAREYRRIVGGVAWPHNDQQGFICVIGEGSHLIRRLRLRPNYLLAEYQVNDIERLIKRMYDTQNKYLVNYWYGDTDNAPMLHFVDRYNRKIPRGKKGLYLSDAPFMDDPHNLRLYTHLIKSQVLPNKKILNFGEQSLIPANLNSLSPEDAQSKKAENFPIVAALGYALSALDQPYSDAAWNRGNNNAIMQQQVNRADIAERAMWGN